MPRANVRAPVEHVRKNESGTIFGCRLEFGQRGVGERDAGVCSQHVDAPARQVECQRVGVQRRSGARDLRVAGDHRAVAAQIDVCRAAGREHAVREAHPNAVADGDAECIVVEIHRAAVDDGDGFRGAAKRPERDEREPGEERSRSRTHYSGRGVGGTLICGTVIPPGPPPKGLGLYGVGSEFGPTPEDVPCSSDQ